MRLRTALTGVTLVVGVVLGLTTAGDAQGPVVLRNSSGTEIATSGNPVRTDPTGTTTQPVSAASLPLPAGAATSTKQSDGSQKTQVVDGAGNVIGATSNALDINIKSGNPTTMTVTQGTGTNLHVVCDSGCSSSTAPADNSAFTAGTTSSSPISAFYHSTIDTMTDGRIGAVGMDSKRNLFNVIRDAAGNNRGANVTAANALVVDGSGVTQPVSGTVTTTPPANASTNVTQWAGTAVDANSGTKSAGTLRVVIATDQPALTNKLLVTPDSVALPANQSVNVSQINGVTPLMGNGTTGTGSTRVTVASDNSAVAGFGVGATGAAPPANASYLGGVASGATGGLLGGVTACDSQAFLDMTTATTTEIVALTASRKVYVCYWLAVANGTTVMTFKRGTGTNCGTGTTSISPAWDLAAQVGFSGGGGFGAIFDNQNAGDALCVTSSAAVNLHVFLRYAKY